MVNLILILIIVEITIVIWLIGKIDGLKDTIAKINNDIETVGFKGNLTEFRLSLEFYNKKFQSWYDNKNQKDNLQALDKLLQFFVFAFSLYKFYKKAIPVKLPKLITRK